MDTRADNYAVAFDHSGVRLYSGGADGKVRALQTSDFGLLQHFQAASPIASLAPHPAAPRIAIGAARELIVLDTDSMEPV